jgi:hypothetical protein
MDFRLTPHAEIGLSHRLCAPGVLCDAPVAQSPITPAGTGEGVARGVPASAGTLAATTFVSLARYALRLLRGLPEVGIP